MNQQPYQTPGQVPPQQPPYQQSQYQQPSYQQQQPYQQPPQYQQQQAYQQQPYQQQPYQQPAYQTQPPYQQAPYQQQPYYPQPVSTGKSKVVAALLAFFLGGFGVHEFYLGRPGLGVAFLLVTLLTGWLIVPLIIVGIICLIQMIMYLSMSDQEFAAKYH